MFGPVRGCVSAMVAEIQQCLAVSHCIYGGPWPGARDAWVCVCAIVTKTAFGIRRESELVFSSCFFILFFFIRCACLYLAVFVYALRV